ncbi:MAG: hypothetical protein V3U90_02890, partial [Dehalococcoidia bacterium]
VTTVKNYNPVTYYEKLIEIFCHMISGNMLLKRLQTTSGMIRFLYLLRAHHMRRTLGAFRNIVELMKTDLQFRAFHEGESQTLPEFYHYQYERALGPYATLLSREDRQPLLLKTQPALAPSRHRGDKKYNTELDVVIPALVSTPASRSK